MIPPMVIPCIHFIRASSRPDDGDIGLEGGDVSLERRHILREIIHPMLKCGDAST